MNVTTSEHHLTLKNRLRALSCARDLSEVALETLSDVAIRKKASGNKYLWNMGDPADFVALILSGAVEVVKTSDQGKETCLGIFGPSSAIGISAMIRKGQYPAAARSICKQTEVLKLYLRPLLQQKNHPAHDEISTWLRELLLSHEQILRDKIDIISLSPLSRRTLELFRQLTSRLGVRSGRSTYRISPALSKTLLARLAEVRTESMIRLLKAWEKKKLIQFHRDHILIQDLQVLERSIENSIE